MSMDIHFQAKYDYDYEKTEKTNPLILKSKDIFNRIFTRCIFFLTG